MAIIYPDGKTQYLFRVLATRERNLFNDSDFYAIVYDDETDSIKEITYDSTRYAGGGYAEEDAPQEIHEKAKAAWVVAHLDDYRERTIEYNKEPIVGSRIKVVRGRKNKHGRTGKVEFLSTKKSKFGKGTYTVVTFTPDDDPDVLAYDYLRNVEAVEVEIPTDAELARRLLSFAERGAYLRPNYRPGVIVL